MICHKEKLALWRDISLNDEREAQFPVGFEIGCKIVLPVIYQRKRNYFAASTFLFPLFCKFILCLHARIFQTSSPQPHSAGFAYHFISAHTMCYPLSVDHTCRHLIRSPHYCTVARYINKNPCADWETKDTHRYTKHAPCRMCRRESAPKGPSGHESDHTAVEPEPTANNADAVFVKGTITPSESASRINNPRASPTTSKSASRINSPPEPANAPNSPSLIGGQSIPGTTHLTAEDIAWIEREYGSLKDDPVSVAASHTTYSSSSIDLSNLSLTDTIRRNSDWADYEPKRHIRFTKPSSTRPSHPPRLSLEAHRRLARFRRELKQRRWTAYS